MPENAFKKHTKTKIFFFYFSAFARKDSRKRRKVEGGNDGWDIRVTF